MSDAQKLKDCIAEYRKANKHLDDELNKAENQVRQNRQAQKGQSSRPA